MNTPCFYKEQQLRSARRRRAATLRALQRADALLPTCLRSLQHAN